MVSGRCKLIYVRLLFNLVITMNTKLEWLLPFSDLIAGMEDEGEGEGEDIFRHFQLLKVPVCEIDCSDGAQYYKTLAYWGVTWPNVSLAHFLPAWDALELSHRTELLESHRAFAEELHVTDWKINMLKRDDLLLFEHVFEEEKEEWNPEQMIKLGAVHCLERWLKSGKEKQSEWCTIAAKHGQLPMLKMLRSHDCPWD